MEPCSSGGGEYGSTFGFRSRSLTSHDAWALVIVVIIFIILILVLVIVVIFRHRRELEAFLLQDTLLVGVSWMPSTTLSLSLSLGLLNSYLISRYVPCSCQCTTGKRQRRRSICGEGSRGSRGVSALLFWTTPTESALCSERRWRSCGGVAPIAFAGSSRKSLSDRLLQAPDRRQNDGPHLSS